MTLTHDEKIIFKDLVKQCGVANVVSYTHVGRLVGLEGRSPILHAMLGHISDYTDEKHKLLLSVLVVTANELTPGEGFYKLGEELTGKKVKNKDKFFIDEMNKCHKFKGWKN